MLRHLFVSALVLTMLISALAQPDPRNLPTSEALQMPMLMLGSLDQVPVITKTTPIGVFALRHGVLVKFDAVTLQQQGMLELLGPVSEWDKNRLADKDDGMMMLLERARLMLPPGIAVDGTMLFITLGGQLFASTGRSSSSNTVCKSSDRPAAEYCPLYEYSPAIATKAASLFLPCQLEVNGKTLQISRDNQIVFVNTEDGKITARASMPALLSASLITMPKDSPFAIAPGVMEAVDGKTYTTLGVITHHAEVNDGCWTVKEYDGTEVVLLNGPGSARRGMPRIEGARVLLRGTFAKEQADMPKYGKGYLLVNSFLLLRQAEAGKE